MARPDSENGWRPPWVGQDALEWVVVPGTAVHLQIQKGQPLQIMRAYAADYNAYVEPLRDADSACYTPTNSVSTSNHLNGTAMDLNWNSHPFHSNYGGYNPQMIAVMEELVDFYEGTMFWAQAWTDPKDCMHHQMGYKSWNNPHTAEFINRKIRADGYSTFRRGGAAMPSSTAADILARATGLSFDRAATILPAVASGLKAADCTNANRIAMWLAQVGHESVSFEYTAEIASGDAYDTRTDLGNTPEVDGDGRLYKGRTWIQITGKSNYRQFSAWAFAKGLCPSPTYFVDHPLELSYPAYAGIGAAWYWTVARSDINALSDKQDIETVTRRINGGTNGLTDRRARYSRALALGDQLLQLLSAPSIELDEWEALMASDTKYTSRSIYRDSDAATMTPLDAVFGADATSHMNWIEDKALTGDAWALEQVAKLAKGQLPASKDPWAVERANYIISVVKAKIAAQNGTK